MQRRHHHQGQGGVDGCLERTDDLLELDVFQLLVAEAGDDKMMLRHCRRGCIRPGGVARLVGILLDLLLFIFVLFLNLTPDRALCRSHAVLGHARAKNARGIAAE